jgi:lipopolysaccharide transport system permease protein
MIPLAAAAAPAVDFLFSFFILAALMIWYDITPTWWILALPFFLILAFTTALAVGVWLAPLNVKYRDVGHTIPFLSQIWMYASPIVYPVSLVPEQWQLLYSLNPMVGVIEGFRWALLGKESPNVSAVVISIIAVMVLLFSGMMYFKKMERTFADVV